jgi:hypothetical protein
MPNTGLGQMSTSADGIPGASQPQAGQAGSRQGARPQAGRHRRQAGGGEAGGTAGGAGGPCHPRQASLLGSNTLRETL